MFTQEYTSIGEHPISRSVGKYNEVGFDHFRSNYCKVKNIDLFGPETIAIPGIDKTSL